MQTGFKRMDTSPPSKDQACHVVIVEDDREIAMLVSGFLTQHGITVTRASTGRQLQRVLSTQNTDLILLDIMLPDVDGLTICRRLRGTVETRAIPIIIVSALGSQLDRVQGLDTGADDYLVKPFAPEELLARVRAVMRRQALVEQRSDASQEVLEAEGFQLDLRRRALRDPRGARISLTTTELALLAVFMRHPQTVLSRDQIAMKLHGRNAEPFDRSIDIAVSRLRRKIEPDPDHPRLIETVRHGGYVFTPPVRTLPAGA
jgi:two-component system OmpR family response regulator